MQTSRRRTVATSLRVAVGSGAAAIGWLLLGATGAQASEEMLAPAVPDAATAISRTVTEPASTAELAPPVTPSTAEEAVAGAEAVVEPVADQLPIAVEQTLAVAPDAEEALPPGSLPQVTDSTVPAVQDTVHDAFAPAAPVVEQLTTPVEQIVPEVPDVGGEPAVRPPDRPEPARRHPDRPGPC